LQATARRESKRPARKNNREGTKHILSAHLIGVEAQSTKAGHDILPERYIIIARKIFFPNFRGARAPPAPPSPTPMFNRQQHKTTTNRQIA